MEGVSDFREVPDEPSVEVHKSYEGLDVLHFHQLWPVCDSLDFNRVHCYMVFGYDESKVVHLSTLKFAFLWLEEQLVGTEGLEYLSSDPPMVYKGGGVDEDVIHVATASLQLIKGQRMLFIIIWKVAGELHSPKNMTSGLKSPQFVEKAAFHSSPSFSWTLLKPQWRSKVVNHSTSQSLVSMSETNGSG